MTYLKYLTVLLGLGLAPAQASPVTFDFSAPPGQQSSWHDVSKLSQSETFTRDGLTLTLGAISDSWGQNPSRGHLRGNHVDAYLGFYRGGAGILNSSSDGAHTVDGYGWNDMLTFSFDRDVSLSGLSFGYGRGRYRLAWDSDGDGEIGAGDRVSASSGISGGPISVDGVPEGRLFGVGAFGNRDSWKLESASFEVSPVPLPAASLLLGGALAGLGGLGAARRRRRQTA